MTAKSSVLLYEPLNLWHERTFLSRTSAILFCFVEHLEIQYFLFQLSS